MCTGKMRPALLVLWCVMHATFVDVIHAEVACPSSSTTATVSTLEGCVCNDGSAIQSVQPGDQYYCPADSATFTYESICGFSQFDVEFTSQNIVPTCSDPNTDPFPPFFRGVLHVSVNTTEYFYITCEKHVNGDRYFLMWGENVDSHNTPYNDQLYAYQLVQKDNELNTGNWIELCFSIQPKIGVHVCPVDTEDDFTGGCTACKVGLSKRRAGTHMCQCDSTATTCACTPCKNEESKLEFEENPNFCACTDRETDVCPESIDAKQLTNMYANRDTLSLENCIEFV
jgi:hypothetical protein